MANLFDNVKFFKPAEFIVSPTCSHLGLDNNPPDFITYSNIYLLARYLDYVRDKFGKPIVINSGYRSPALNDAVGGVKYSKHLDGLAVDIKVLHITDYENNY